MPRADHSLSVPVAEVLDPALWRERYAYGLVLGEAATRGSTLRERVLAAKRGAAGPNGDAAAIEGLPDSVIRWHLRVALSEVGTKLGIPLSTEVIKADPVDEGLVRGIDYDRVVPRLPYRRAETDQWFMLPLENNVVSVERIRAYWYDDLIMEVSPARGNADLIAIQHPRQGIVHVVPANLQSLTMDTAGNYGAWFTIVGALAHAPYFWAVDYTRGPIARDGSPQRIEAVLAHYVYCTAGLTLLALDSVARIKGITSSSLSLDGVSRSISVSPHLHQVLADTWEAALKRIDWPSLRTSHRGLRLRMYGAS